MANSDNPKGQNKAVSAEGVASMLRTDTDRQRIIEKVRQDNENEYGLQARLGVGKILSASHPHPWTYVYELTQNALDAGANRVSWQLTDNGVRFQHDGSTALDESDVRGISSLGMSTKGLTNVGFMGLGFKSVFARFRTVHVSGFGFRFRFEIHTTKGNLGQQIIEWFDSLLPLWDAEYASDPDSGYTTSFSLERPVVPTETLANDLELISSLDDPTPLAVLALRGLKQVRVDNFQWDLEVDENGSVVVNRRSSDDEHTSWRWQSFVSRYRPDDGAMRRFLEVRQQLHEHVGDDGQRIDREVVGLIPLDGNGLPNPPDHGKVYATLPTQAQIPFGFHLQADWFVDIDRQNLRDVEGDAWQELIVNQVPHIVRQFLVWLTGQSESARKRGYPAALRDPHTDDGILSKPFQALHDHLVDTLAGESVIPIHGIGPTQFRTPDGVARLPGRFSIDYGRRPEWRPDLLFDRDLMDEELLTTGATKFFTWLGCGRDIGRNTVPWPDKLAHWWNALPADTRTDALFALWHGVMDLDWIDAPVVPTEARTWVRMSEIRWLNEPAPTEKQPSGAVVAELLADSLPSADRRVPRELRARVVENTQHDGAQCFKIHRTDVSLSSLVQQAFSGAEGDHDLRLIALLEWALSRGPDRRDLVPWVLTEQGARKPSDALLADPLVEGALYRRKICPDKPALVADYASVDDRAKVIHFLERLGVCAGDPLREIETRLDRYSKREVAKMLGISKDNVMEANNDGYTVLDHGFPFRLDEVDLDALQIGLTRGLSFLRGKGRRNAKSHYYGRIVTYGRHGTAAWVRALQAHPWLLCDDGQRRKPAEVLLHPDPDFEGAIGSVDPSLAERLQAEGVQFGSEVQKSPALRRLSRRGADPLADSELAALLDEAFEEVDRGHVTEKDLLEALDNVRLHGVPLTRVVQQTGAGLGHRSDLGSWVVALEGVEQSLSAAIKELPLTIPVTTTGRQALDYLLYIWNEKPQRVETIRGSIAAAYRYVLDDRDSGDLSDDEWRAAREQAYMYGQSGWHALSPNLVVADVQSPRIRRFLPEGRVIVAAAHLGDNDDQIERVARGIGIGLLSEDVKVSLGTRINGPACVARLRKLVGALSSLEDRRELQDIAFHDEIVLQVDGTEHRINAYVADGALLLVGEPHIFAADAAEQIVGYFRLSQRSNVVPYLTMALSNLDHEDVFHDYLEIVADGLGVDVPEDMAALAPVETWATAEDVEMFDPSANGDEDRGETDQDETDRRVDEAQTQATPTGGNAGGMAGGGDGARRSGSGHDRRGRGSSAAGRSSRDSESTARTTSGSTASRRSAADHFGIVVERGSGHERESPDDQSHTTEESRWDDHKAREAVIEYEHSQGRSAKAMPDDHPGYDVESVDSTPGLESPIIRRIEVKGVRGIFDREASVVLSARQVHDAINHREGDEEYWLYVVDSTESAKPRVFPIPWTRYRASLKYGFYARVWAATAEQPTGST